MKDKIAERAKIAKERYDDANKVQWRPFHNKKVYLKNLGVKKEGKLAPRCLGPFLASCTDVQWNYRIEDCNGNTKVVHIDQLKACPNPDQPLAAGLQGRGRPRLYPTRVFYAARPWGGGEV